MKAITILLLLLPVALAAQERPVPVMLLGGMFNTDRAALQFSMTGPGEQGFIHFYGGADFKEHALSGVEMKEPPLTYNLHERFPLRTYQFGLLYSHLIRSVATVGIGVQYRQYREYAEYRSAVATPSTIHVQGWFKDRFDFAATAGWIFAARWYATLTYTTHKEILLGVAIAVR